MAEGKQVQKNQYAQEYGGQDQGVAPYNAEREDRFCLKLGPSAMKKNIPLIRQTTISEVDTLLRSGRTI